MSRILLLIVLSLFLASCQSTSDDSEETKTTSPKKAGDDPESGGLFSSVLNKSSPKTIALPPDLISKANSKVKENHDRGEQQRNSQTVLPEIAGTRMMRGEDGTKWLQVETDAQTVWDTLANFWAAEQIDLVEYQPAAGLMETDWIASDRPTEGNKPSAWASLFNRVVGKGTSFDKYKVRLDRDGDNLTNIYVTHRATARKESNFASQVRITEWNWVEGDSDQEKVAQLLQVMVLLFENSAQEPA